uniref:Genome polyprotein n=1 Tax=limnipivirus C1 TaxID=1401263 RepID=A0A023IN43_9PICO|nr:polyprotein [limnipivirus C1]
MASIIENLTTTFASSMLGTAEDAVGSLMDAAVRPVEAPNVIISDQSAVAESEIYETGTVPPALTASTVEQEVGQMNIQRFVRLDAAEWSTSSAAEVKLKEWKLPDVFYDSKYPTYNLMKNYHWMRSDFEFNLIVNANMGFAGALVLVYVPDGAHFQFDTFRNFPHAMINCSLNTSASLKIPYINMTQYCGIKDDEDNNGTLRLYVLAQLKVPSSGGQVSNWTLYGKLVTPEFQAFSVLQGPGSNNAAVRVEQGEGAMFMASRHHTALRPRMGLTSERSSSDAQVVGDSAFRSLKQVTNIESLWMALDWAYTDEIGKQLLVTNVIVKSDSNVGSIKNTTNLGFLSNFYHGYKGDLCVSIQSVASRLNQGKLLIVFYPGEDNDGADLSIDNINNAFTQILDLGGKTTVRFTLPYVCQQTYRPMHGVFGRFAVFVLNPLTYTPACPSAVRVIFYIGTSSSFSFVYPKEGTAKFQGDDDDVVIEEEYIEEPVTNIEDEASTSTRIKRPVFRNVRVSLPDQIKSDHMLLANLFGRAHALKPTTSTTADKTAQLVPTAKSFLNVFKLFRYRSGDMTVHIMHTATGPLVVAHSYISDDLGTVAEDNYSRILSQGSVAMKPASNASLCVPFYVLTPFVESMQLGKLLMSSLDDTTYSVRLALTFDRNTRFYFLQSPPDVVAADFSDDEFDDFEGPSDWSRLSLLERTLDRLAIETTYPVKPVSYAGRFLHFHSKAEVDGVPFYAQGKTKRECRLKLLEQILAYKRDLTACGDVESNPGPVLAISSTFGWSLIDEGVPITIPALNLSNAAVVSSPIDSWWQICEIEGDFLRNFNTALSANFAPDIAIADDVPQRYTNTAIFLQVMSRGLVRRVVVTPFISMFMLAGFSRWIRARFARLRLLLSGDVEQNPGPVFFYKETDLGTHFLCPLNSANTRFLGIYNIDNFIFSKEIRITSRWSSVSPANTIVITERQFTRLTVLGGHALDGHDVRFVFDDQTLEDTPLPCLYALVAFCMARVVDAESPISGVVQWMLGVDASAIANAQLASTLFTDDNLRRVLGDAWSEASSLLLKGFFKVLMFAFILSQSSSSLTLLSVSCLVAADVSSAVFQIFQSCNVSSLINYLLPGEDVIGCCERARMVELAHDIFKDFTDTAEDFTSMTQLARNLDWWVQRLLKLASLISEMYNPDEIQRSSKILKKDETVVVQTIAGAADLYQDIRTSGSVTNEHRNRYDELHEQLVMYQKLANMVPRHPFQIPINQALMTMKSVRYGHRAPEKPIRPDPVGIHFCGIPGMGKTVLMTRICNYLAKALKTEVYVHAPGAEFLDGYSGQKVHYIDEFLAHVDEKEANLILQLMGCSNTIVPMADLDDKGKYYQAEVVITTSNTLPSSHSKLKFPQAVARRFKVLEFKVNSLYTTVVNGQTVLDGEKAMRDGSFQSGECWSFCVDGLNWKTFSFKKFVAEVMDMIDKNRKFYENFSKILDDDVDDLQAPPETPVDSQTILDTLEIEGLFAFPRKLVAATKTSVQYAKNWITEQCKGWTLDKTIAWVSRVGVAVNVLRIVHSTYTFIRDLTKCDVEAPYDKAIRVDPRKVLVKRAARRNVRVDTAQAPVESEQYEHFAKPMVFLKFEDRKHNSRGFAIAKRQIITYAHGLGNGNLIVHYGGIEMNLTPDDYTISVFVVEDGETDMACIEFVSALGVEFPDLTHLISAPEYGRDARLLTAWGGSFHIRTGENLTKGDYSMLRDPNSGKMWGMRFGHFRYLCKTQPGDCGSIIIQKQNGTWKLVGMHNASGQGSAVAFRFDLYPLDIAEGVIVSKEKSTMRSFMPSKSKLRESPFHGAFPVEKEPAVLSSRDTRLIVNIDSLVKTNGEKYRVDRFDPNTTVFAVAAHKVKERFQNHIPLGYMITMEDAIRGGDINPIDKDTSPGYKYVSRGFRKCDLYQILPDGTVQISDMLRKDVEAWLTAIKTGKEIDTLFTAHLKDELRSCEKVELGKTRVIEAAELDFVVAYRMYMSSIYSGFYNTAAHLTGIAAGINPPRDGHELYAELCSYSKFLALDYSRFDGSLPEMLMRKAVEILAELHESPDEVARLHETVIVSKHLVLDELWTVKGGMPSGSPCTTILNCICNLLVLEYSFLDTFGIDYQFHFDGDYTSRDFLTVVYGDDCIVAYNGPEVGAALAEVVKNAFGMEITPASKVGEEYNVEIQEIEFLKRTFFRLRGQRDDRIALRLSLTTIFNSLMWMRNRKTFADQVFSLMVELSAWGREQYDLVVRKCRERLKENREVVTIPSYDLAFETYLGIVDWDVVGEVTAEELFPVRLEISDEDD